MLRLRSGGGELGGAPAVAPPCRGPGEVAAAAVPPLLARRRSGGGRDTGSATGVAAGDGRASGGGGGRGGGVLAACAGGAAALAGAAAAARRRRRGICHAWGAQSGESSGAGERQGIPPQWRPDLFLQLPFNNGVLLSGLLSSVPQAPPLLPPAASGLPPLAIVPVSDGGAAPCVPFDGGVDADVAAALRRRLSAGPMRPKSVGGRALQRTLQMTPERFALVRDYELLRAALGTVPAVEPPEQAEALLLCAYARLLEHGGAPPRPSCREAEDFDKYSQTFGGAAMQALERTTTADFQLIAKAHVLGLVQSADLPRMALSKARDLYSNAMRFGHALRQAETRFQADRAAGTFVPLPLEAQLLREELEEVWALSAAGGSSPGLATTIVADEDKAPSPAASPAMGMPEGDAEAAHRSLREALARLRRIGEARPGLATYLGWLGRFDPEALSLLATPSPVLAVAMRMQVVAIWGEMDNSEDGTPAMVTTTPSDMIEAVIFGAWLRDAAVEAEEVFARHRQRGCDDLSEEL
mmetsp:Transcript_90433/g.193906  ORF Transcript_90433/g.193906 Transcript_90433/m.193906 type:complete len:526 (+) Transcript_90433:69-1646(+)